MNPISELQADITTTKLLQRDIKNSFNSKKKAITKFFETKEKAQNKLLTEPTEPMQKLKSPSIADTQKYHIIDDANKEQALLKMAKKQYQSYQDVARFAEALSLRPGVVYLTLKHHNFIQQNETTEYRVLDAYYRTNGNLKLITLETELKVWIVSKTLENLGLSPNWASYKERAEKDDLGDWAEAEFKRLVPSALDMNMQYQMNNPEFDFLVNDKTVDVKASNFRNNRGNATQYYVRIRKDTDSPLPDYFCLFLILDRNKSHLENGNYAILLIPKEVIPSNQKSISIVQKDSNNRAISSMYWDFEIDPPLLSMVLGDI